VAEAPPVEDPKGVEAEVGEAPPPSVRRIAKEVRDRSTILRCTLGAVAAWAITVAPLVVSGRASFLVRVLALASLSAGLAGPQLLPRNDRAARQVGITLFLFMVLITWTLASLDAALTGLDPFRAILGSLGWGVFALGWSHPWSVPDHKLATAPEGDTAGLKPRRTTPHYAVGVAVIGAACAALCLGLAWRIPDPNRAVFAQAVAVGAAVALLTSASAIAVFAGRESRRERSRRRLPFNRRVLNNLLLMAVVVALALLLRFTQ